MAWGDKQIKGNTANGLITITAYHWAMASIPTIAQRLKAWRWLNHHHRLSLGDGINANNQHRQRLKRCHRMAWHGCMVWRGLRLGMGAWFGITANGSRFGMA
ncbi:hypothetical protein [Moraxella sp. FZLJ2109]|uniref:hypothetical protein n=1 Tax=Moraxella sp. FZLJ2109 TaxID=2961890 RepID=UPI0020C8F149|nr:hypothetical protein [Moraxella sp. FZLJ2109]UTO21500.1 hypothetical protein NKU06_06545 [Moraxella sp. FZLJ2109]